MHQTSVLLRLFSISFIGAVGFILPMHHDNLALTNRKGFSSYFPATFVTHNTVISGTHTPGTFRSSSFVTLFESKKSNEGNETSIINLNGDINENINVVDTSNDGANQNFNLKAYPKRKPKKASESISYQTFKLFSYFIQFLGFFFFCGFLLNLSGYGYYFDTEGGGGLKIDKMENIRNEMQFRREMERMSVTKEQRPSSGLISPGDVLEGSIVPESTLPR